MKDLGTNNVLAYRELCEDGEKHHWVFTELLGRCYEKYECVKCGAIHRIDSSD